MLHLGVVLIASSDERMMLWNEPGKLYGIIYIFEEAFWPMVELAEVVRHWWSSGYCQICSVATACCSKWNSSAVAISS